MGLCIVSVTYRKLIFFFNGPVVSSSFYVGHYSSFRLGNFNWIFTLSTLLTIRFFKCVSDIDTTYESFGRLSGSSLFLAYFSETVLTHTTEYGH